MGWLKNRQDRRAERQAHNDRDYECRYWWGDRSGSAVGVYREHCRICNPLKKKPYVITHSQSPVAGTGGV